MRLWGGAGASGQGVGGAYANILQSSPARASAWGDTAPAGVITSPGEAPTCLRSHPTSWGPEHQTRGQD